MALGLFLYPRHGAGLRKPPFLLTNYVSKCVDVRRDLVFRRFMPMKLMRPPISEWAVSYVPCGRSDVNKVAEFHHLAQRTTEPSLPDLDNDSVASPRAGWLREYGCDQIKSARAQPSDSTVAR